jgi:hypothetical protein
MNLARPGNFTGKTMLASDAPPYFADYYHSGMLGWIEDDLLVEIPVANTEKISCYQPSSDKLQKNKIACPTTSKQARDRAIAFTSRIQSLLFNGKTINSAD